MRLFIAAAIATFSFNAFATVDGHDRVFIVVQHIQDEEEFFVERAPIIGCYGLPQGARLVQFTAPYKVPSNIGCGGEAFSDNINALSCAKVIKQVESADYASFSEITLDISKCAAKDKPKFITMVRTAAKFNFPQSDAKKEVILNLVK